MQQPKNNLKIIADKKNARVILPNMLTLIGVCIGLTSIRFALDEKFEFAIIAILFAALFDWLDGRIARLIKGTSEVGKELDSLADVISFGVAPAFIMYFWTLSSLGKFGWLVCLIYVSCVALRLARFNVNSNQEPSWRDNFFEGVPSPAGGILVLTPLIFSLSELEFITVNYKFVVPIFFVTISLLLISKFPTYSFKKIIIPRKTTIFLLFGIVLFFGVLLIYTFKVLAITSLIYLLLIPISYLHFQKIKKKKNVNDLTDDAENLEDIL
ncbi:CDP-diacylglycerol--serine O-phosphatidyltransferase [Candidatus Pelagibacter sp.]|nr:CDP-diacylglycerol--serine O-phosphatidyltransferase [Candidatus Pelagibacter sp.]MDC0900776.1 CDP-diacylglycerol--serine O-phosphatidyltransferase [Candidatus Pelagibacter sp.]MDC1069536.1 CDP-diacylglycerol--serine O-phosphatidyltransferase [Candidatus Pelagibacter sp.]